MIQTLRETFNCPIGYSGHEVGLVTSAVAVGLGACMVERHITLDRALWGSDQAASVEPGGFETTGQVHPCDRSGGGRWCKKSIRERNLFAEKVEASTGLNAQF